MGVSDQRTAPPSTTPTARAATATGIPRRTNGYRGGGTAGEKAPLPFRSASEGSRRTNDAVELSEREAVLLAVLMSAPRRVFTRGHLLDAVFAGSDSPGVIDTYVHYLRRKLGRGVVHTVHGTGYRLGNQ